MPSPTLPTGSVSDGSNGARTFPVRDGPPSERVRDAPEEPPKTDGRGPDRPVDRTPQSDRAELAHLRRENAELRRALRETRQQRQEVIDRYERLLDGREPDGGDAAETASDFEVAPATGPPASPLKPLAERVADEIETRWATLRRRYRRWANDSAL